MKYFFLSLAFFSASTFTYSQSSHPIKATLEAATVFAQGAELNHTARINLTKGNHEILIDGFAFAFDENSTQVEGSESTTILSVQKTANYLSPPTKSPEKIRIEDSLKVVRNSLTETLNQKSAEEGTLELLNKNQAVGGTAGVNVEELNKLAEFYKAQHIQIKTRVSALTEKEEELKALEARLRQQLQEINGEQDHRQGQLRLQVLSLSDGPKDFSIRYITPHARWEPYYEIQTKDINSPINIRYKANVIQNTGIPWNEVNLTLSTGNPSESGTVPSLAPWFLRFMRQNSGIGNIGLQEMARVAAAPVYNEVVFESAAPEAQTMEPYISHTMHQLNASFEIEIPYTIAPNGKPHSVSLKEISHNATYKYYVVPKADPDAFLVAELADYETLNLMPGEANIIFENTYVGKSWIDPYDSGDTLRLGMGRDKTLAIEKERIMDHTRTQTIGNNKTQTFAFDITVKNNKNQAIDLSLEDQIPLSTDKNIQVELLESGGAQVDKESGSLTWLIRLQPTETKTIRVSYSVRYPKDQTIAGF